MDNEARQAFEDLAWAIAEKLDNLPLLDADRALDDARRIVCFTAFSGYSDQEVMATVEPSEIVADIAVSLRGQSAAQAMAIIDHARITIWAAQFTNAPWSRFAKAQRLATMPTPSPHLN